MLGLNLEPTRRTKIRGNFSRYSLVSYSWQTIVVMVAGRTTKTQFGCILIVGPVTNIFLWCFGIFIAFLLGGFNSHLDQIIKTWLWGNSILAAFNMPLFGPLDGKKIKTWSEVTFYVWFTIRCCSYLDNNKLCQQDSNVLKI